MIPYFIAFFTSILFCWLGERSSYKFAFISKIFYLLSVLIISIFTALRDLNIGTDIQTYAIWEFNDAIASNDLADFVINRLGIMEPFYSVLNYIVSCFTNNIHWLLFIIAILIYGFTLAGLYKYNSKIAVWMGWACFLFIFYGDTLNMLRQSIAISICFWGFHYVLDLKDKRFWVTLFIAFLFHNSAIIFIPIYFLYKVLIRRNTFFFDVSIILCFIFAICYYQLFLELFMNIGLLPEKFIRYISYGFNLEVNPIILRLPFIVFALCFYKQFVFKDSVYSKAESTLYILMLIFDMISCQLRSILVPLYRISLYFGIYKLIVYSRIYFITKNKFFMGTMLLIFLIALWIYQNVVQGNNEIYPYTSNTLGI